MSQETEDIKRWTARRKAAAVMDIIKGRTTAAELARSHGLTVSGGSPLAADASRWQKNGEREAGQERLFGHTLKPYPERLSVY